MTKNNFKTRRGFTLIEVMVAAVVFILAFVGILISYLKCLELNEFAKNSSLAVSVSQSRLEKIKNIRNKPFNQIKATYNNVTFTSNELTGIGVSYIDDSNPKLLKITVTFCWQQSNRRVIGEDQNLNGQLNVNEDKNANGILDSPTTLVSYIYDR